MSQERYLRIDAHGHLLPYPNEIPQFMRDRELFWITDDRQFMCQGSWRRPVTDPSFFLNEKLAWMDTYQIDHEVILTLSQLYANGMDQQSALDMIQFQNDFNAGVQAAHGDRFTCGFVVQPAWIDDALREMDRCIHTLGLRLLCLPTNFRDQQGQWHSIAHETAEPIFELANEHGIPIEIHPYDGPKFIHLEDRFWRFHLVWMCAQTADAYHMYTSLGYDTKYPNVRICFAHGNQYGQVNVGRRIQGFEGRPDLFTGARHPKESLGRSNLYFDSLVHDVLSFELLIKRQGTSQVLIGFDDPYPLGEMEGVGDGYPGKLADDAVALNIISEADRRRMWSDNTARWLWGDESEQWLSTLNQSL